MGHGSEGAHVVINHHSGAVDARTYSIIEDQRHTVAHQLLEVSILLGILCLRNDDAAHLILIEVIADGNFSVISFLALRHHHTIASGSRFLLYTRKNGHKIIMYQLRNDNSYHFHRLHLAMSQSLSDDVGIEIMFPRIRLYTLLLGSTDSRAVLQSSAHRGDTNTQVASYIFHCYNIILIHDIFPHAAKLDKYPLSCFISIDINQAKRMQTIAHKK